jgi:hypothetical protein
MSAATLPPALLAMMARGVSVIVASRDQAMRPSLMRAVGSRIGAGQEITVFLARRQSRQVIQDIAATGHLAVVFSEPATHRTVQVKSSRARIRNAAPEDRATLENYLRSMEHEIGRIGIPVQLTRAMLAHELEDVVAISFVAEQAFDQTPGPRAGARLGSA